MIYLPGREAIIITPPKTASRSLGDALCRGHQGLLIFGPSMDGRVDHHTAVIPPAFSHCDVLAVVRHPLDRLVSLWFHLVYDEAYQGRTASCFRDFALRIARGQESDPFYEWSLCRHLAGVKHFVSIQHDQLRNDLADNNVFLPEPMPRLGTSHRQPWRSYFDHSLVDLVGVWARPDADRFGYSLS